MDVQNSVKNITTFAEMLPFVEEARPRVSWWGARIVCIPSTGEELHIDSLASKMGDLHERNPNFLESERPLIRKITGIIDQIYDQNDAQLASCNFITRIIARIRDLLNSMFPHSGYSATRWFWRECRAINCLGEADIPDLYTKLQCEEVFGFDPSFGDQYSGSSVGGHKRWNLYSISQYRDRVSAPA